MLILNICHVITQTSHISFKCLHGRPSSIQFLLTDFIDLSIAALRNHHKLSSLQWWWLSRSVVSDSCDPMDYSLPVSSVHGILQARILESVAVLFARGSSQPRDWTQVSCIAGGFFTNFTITQVYYLTILEVRSPAYVSTQLNPGVGRSVFPSEGSRGQCFLAFSSF